MEFSFATLTAPGPPILFTTYKTVGGGGGGEEGGKG